MKKLIQIGANIGYADGIPDYTATILASDVFEAILVEPNPKAMEKLKEGYKQFNYNIHYENIAISSEDGIAILYVDNYESINPENLPEWVPNRNEKKFDDPNIWVGCSPHASFNLNFQYAHLHGLGRDTITPIQVKTLTLNSLISKYNWNNQNIDYLFIDTEGHDCDIILSTDFSKLKINCIKFETTHSDGPFTKGEKLNKTINYLLNYGYSVSKIETNDITLIK